MSRVCWSSRARQRDDRDAAGPWHRSADPAAPCSTRSAPPPGAMQVIVRDGRVPGLELVRTVILAFGRPAGRPSGRIRGTVHAACRRPGGGRRQGHDEQPDVRVTRRRPAGRRRDRSAHAGDQLRGRHACCRVNCRRRRDAISIATRVRETGSSFRAGSAERPFIPRWRLTPPRPCSERSRTPPRQRSSL